MAASIVGSLNLNSLAPSKSLFDTLDAQQAADSGGISGIPFSEYLSQALDNTNQLLLDSDNVANEFAAGQIDDISQVEVAASKADIALQYTMQVRNKILDAYNEIMRMQI